MIKKNYLILIGSAIIFVILGYFIVKSSTTLQTIRIDKKGFPSKITPEQKHNPKSLSCNSEEDCGVNICECKAMNKSYIRPKDSICTLNCEGTPKCIEGQCELVKEKVNNCYYQRVTCIKSPCNPIRVCSGKNHNLILAVINDLSKRLQLNKDLIVVDSVTETNWRNGSLGCPEPGKVYTQAIVPGYKIILTQNNKIYFFHTNKDGYFIFCDKPED